MADGSKEPNGVRMALAWLGLLMVGLPVVVYLPTHLLLKRVFPPPAPPAG